MATLQRAVTFLKRDARPIAPRRQWPLARRLGHNGRPLNPRNAEGRALCIYGDAGWGEAVHNGKYRDGRFSDELVHASAGMIRERWAPAPAWVTAVPSLRHPRLVADFARRLARALGLPFRPVLTKGYETPEQKTMQNSSHQLANLLHAFQVTEDPPPGAALLVDDIVDSRWTFTICGALLRDAGCETVYPFALATAAGATRFP